MKVVLVNGSRRDAGCTYTALSVVAKELEAQGIDTEIVAVGSRVVKGELDAVVKEVGAKITDADGLIVGSPVYYASPTGEILMFLDRLFGAYGNELRYKCGSSIASARRGGTTSTVDVLNFAWLVKSVDAAKKAGIELPQGENKIKTNYIR